MAEFYQQSETGSSAFEGCPDPTAGKALYLNAGMQSRVCHTLTTADGTPVNLSSFEDYGTSIVIIVGVTCGWRSQVVELSAEDFTDATNGRICFSLPERVDCTPGIYEVQLVFRDAESKPFVGDKFLMSIESSLMTPGKPGPLTLGEVRRALRDYPALNTAWESAEFSPEEVLSAILRPIQTFNETLPRVLRYNPTNFPFREQWLNAAIGHLLKMASHWYMRNSREIKYGDGKTENDKGKTQEYTQIAEMHLQRFTAFCVTEQVTANLSCGFTSFGGTHH